MIRYYICYVILSFMFRITGFNIVINACNNCLNIMILAFYGFIKTSFHMDILGIRQNTVY